MHLAQRIIRTQHESQRERFVAVEANVLASTATNRRQTPIRRQTPCLCVFAKLPLHITKFTNIEKQMELEICVRIELDICVRKG